MTSVGGTLSISHNYSLTSLAGLEQLTSIGQYFTIEDNDSLMSLSNPGLDSLTAVGLSFRVLTNPVLSTCEATDLLDQLTTVPRRVCIRNNATVPSCSDVLTGC